jgi:hypothetical protein
VGEKRYIANVQIIKRLSSGIHSRNSTLTTGKEQPGFLAGGRAMGNPFKGVPFLKGRSSELGFASAKLGFADER